MLHMYPSLAYQRQQSFRCLQIVSEVDLFNKYIYLQIVCGFRQGKLNIFLDMPPMREV